jgi:hypothetical protein
MANLILYSATNVILKICKFLQLWEEASEVREQVPVSQVHEKTQGAYVRASLSRDGSNGKLHDTYGGTSTTLLALVRLVLASRCLCFKLEFLLNLLG